jgi:hypothetical protein
MKLSELEKMVREIIREEMQSIMKEAEGVCEGDGCLDEKSVPEPYNRKTARKMDKGQVDKRKKIGRDMLSNEKTVSKFRKKYGDKWKSYLWAAASSAAFRSSGKSNKNK